MADVTIDDLAGMIKKGFDEVGGRLDKLESGQAKLESGQATMVGRLDKLESGQATMVKRLDKLESGQQSLDSSIKELRKEMRQEFAKLHRRIDELAMKVVFRDEFDELKLAVR